MAINWLGNTNEKQEKSLSKILEDIVEHDWKAQEDNINMLYLLWIPKDDDMVKGKQEELLNILERLWSREPQNNLLKEKIESSKKLKSIIEKLKDEHDCKVTINTNNLQFMTKQVDWWHITSTFIVDSLIYNLISNSYQKGKANNIEVNCTQEWDNFQIKIDDNGKWFNKDNLEKVLSKSKVEDTNSGGVFLMYIQHLLEKLDWEMIIESESTQDKKKSFLYKTIESLLKRFKREVNTKKTKTWTSITIKIPQTRFQWIWWWFEMD